jgi:alcohol dehydrogenase YqhD (iron-dependent ADH family)
MDNFFYHSPTALYFGKGQAGQISNLIKGKFKKILIVTGRKSVKENRIFDSVVKEVEKAGSGFIELSGIKPNPRIESVRQGIGLCKKHDVDLVLGVGGGSVIDASKAVAAGALCDNDCWDFFIKKAEPKEALPVGCVLTLAATGTETNGNCVITDEKSKRKLALCAQVLRPIFSILDPEYTFTVNRYNTAAGIVDIIAHVFEQYFSHTPACTLQDEMSLGVINTCLKYAPVVMEEPCNYEARANIMFAGTIALNGLLGLGRQADWASHGIEHELSALYDIAHGAGLSIIMPNWLGYVLDECTMPKIADYGRRVWSIDPRNGLCDIALKAIGLTKSFFQSLGMPVSLAELDIGSEHFNIIAENVVSHYKTLGHFKRLSGNDVVNILKLSL